MRKYKFLSIILSILFLGAGCSKEFLEKQSLTDETEDNFYQTEEQAFQGLIAVYDALQYINGRTADTYAPWDLINNTLSDDAYAGGSGSGDRPGIVRMNAHQMVATDSEVLALWEDNYMGIARANLLLSKIDAIPFSNPDDKTRIISETKTLRAYFYLQLVKLYGSVPLILEPLAPSQYNSVTQAEPKAVYQQIATDLLDAINGKLPLASAIPQSEYGRISVAAAQGLLMRTYLYYEGYAKGVLGIGENLKTTAGTEITLAMVKQMGDDIISSGQFALVSDFSKLWGTANEVNSEFILTVRHSDIRDWGDWGARNYSEGNWASIMTGFRIKSDDIFSEGWSFSPVTLSLVNSYNDNDKRKAASFVDAADITDMTPGYQHTGYAFRKFHPTKADNPATSNAMLNQPFDRPDLRYADILLMAAELNLSSDAGKALGYFNQVRFRATGENFTGTLTQDEILKERRREFAGEGLRYSDMLRSGLTYTQQCLQAVSGDGDFKISFDPAHKGLLPIPQREINLNPNFSQFVY